MELTQQVIPAGERYLLRLMRMKKPILIRPKDAAYMLGVSTTTLWRLSQRDPSFPKKIHVTERFVGWKAGEIEKWLNKKQLGYC